MEHQKDSAAGGLAAGAADAELLARLRAGDEAAFERLVREQMPMMLAVARRMLRSEDDAQDAAQEAFTSAFKSLGAFEGNSKLGTWLHSITVRACLMRLRTKRRKPEQSIEELLPAYKENGHRLGAGPAWGDSPEAMAQRTEVRELVRKSIERLPDSYRNVLMLRDIEEMSTQQAAEALEISEALVKTRLHRARQALRELLDAHWRAEAQ